MNVLELDSTSLQRIRNEGMVDLLRVLVENIAVPFNQRYPNGFINIGEDVKHGLVCGTGLGELVIVSSNHEIGMWIFAEKGLRECLPRGN